MKQDILISVVIPTYNMSNYLKNVYQSLCNQNYKNLEILFVNDGSTDNTISVLEDFQRKDERVKIVTIENSGVSIARNTGLEIATGNYVFFCDADDELEPECFEHCVKVIQDDSPDFIKVGFAKKIGTVKKVKKLSVETNTLHSGEDSLINLVQNMFYHDDFSTIGGVLLKSSLAKKHRFDASFSIGEDFLYVSQCLFSAMSVYVIGKPYYVYRVNQNSATHQFEINKTLSTIEGQLEVVNKITHNIEERFSIVADSGDKCKRIISDTLIGVAEKTSYSEYNHFISLLIQHDGIMRYLKEKGITKVDIDQQMVSIFVKAKIKAVIKKVIQHGFN
ncbi:TPA: glycosyltransferase family 2 protein [Streptococcus suis]|uniref:Glycosyltransferase n=1 Tax=Streptococcus suis TaxID=1307 RepID=M1VRI1_STRSU|nr:glycosyltransferase family 2 protein [Streptococcus suis]APZ79110.1 Glycosyltransferase [Streptococcus suis]MCK3935099.1 glycosyltransferase family 2 protein [Streptococcus suis]MDG4527541.1 glycosyltransferase [Streptococcus suis]MDG4529850.1 glycosyltransferase [Streptococcus suis]NQK55353.1 glycosyltransferase family 2 protein [Streptococcus suis]